jgi:hypothetical protein
MNSKILASTVTVDPNTVRYTIVGLGGYYGWYNTAEGNYTLNNLNVSFARNWLPMDQWAPNSSWRKFNADTSGSRVHDSFLLMQDLKNRGIPIHISIWNVANWLVDNPGNTTNRHIPSSNYSDLIEALKAYLLRAKTVYGVEPVVFSFNEANAGVAYLIFSASEYANFIRQAGAAFASAGLVTKFTAGEVTNPSCFSYINDILYDLQTNGGLNYITYLSFHSWGSIVFGWEGPSWSNFIEMATIASRYNLPVMVGELGTDYDGNRSKPLWPTWGWAWDHAQLYQASFLYAKAAVTLHWAFGGGGFNIVNPKTLRPYPIFYVVKHFLNNISPGSKVIPCNSDDTDVWVTGFINSSSNVFTLEMLNVSTSSKTVTFNGVPSTSLSWFRSSSSESYASIQDLAPSGGSVTISVPAQSLNTLTGNFVFVPAPPVITTHSSNATVVEGQTATFSVVATGTTPLTYKWQKNQVDISMETSSSYTTQAVILADSGSKYRCVLTNAYGNATSNEGTLTVNANLVNLALNKATASSVESSSYTADKAVDGNGTTRWSSGFNDPQWISIDLGSTYKITSVILKWEAAYGKSYTIDVSDDGANWTTVCTKTNGTGGTETLTVNGTGRYVRMYGTARGTIYGYSLWEMEVYGTATE